MLAMTLLTKSKMTYACNDFVSKKLNDIYTNNDFVSKK